MAKRRSAPESMIFSIKNDSRPWSISLRGLAVFGFGSWAGAASSSHLLGQQGVLDARKRCHIFFLFYFTRTSDPTTSQCVLWGNISTGVKPSAR